MAEIRVAWEALRSRRVVGDRMEEGERVMDPKEIFELIVKADEKLKYATATRGDLRAQQAADLLAQARSEAEAVGNDALVEQVRVRMADLQAILEGGGGGGGGDGDDGAT